MSVISDGLTPWKALTQPSTRRPPPAGTCCPVAAAEPCCWLAARLVGYVGREAAFTMVLLQSSSVEHAVGGTPCVTGGGWYAPPACSCLKELMAPPTCS